MIRGGRALLAAGALAASLRAAQAVQLPDAPDPHGPASRASAGLRSVLRGPVIRPASGLTTDEAGRLRPLGLDDLTTLHLRVTFPF